MITISERKRRPTISISTKRRAGMRNTRKSPIMERETLIAPRGNSKSLAADGPILWTSFIATLLKIISHFFLKRTLWMEVIVALALFASATFVSIAGHYGAQLTHIEGVGSQGKFLEDGSHDHTH